MTTKAQQEIFKFVHPVSGDVFTYENKSHAYTLNGIDLPGTTTPLELVNELTWDADGKMTSKSKIIQQWALGKMADEVIEEYQKAYDKDEIVGVVKLKEIVIEAKKAPNKNFKDAGVSGTQIHDEIEKIIKVAIDWGGLINQEEEKHPMPQVQNFIDWARRNHVKFLYSEEPIYSKEWMNCGTVDFICEIDGKVLVGDIKTNGDKRRYAWTGKGYDFTKPVSDIHTINLWQAGCYGKMAMESEARKLIDKCDGVVIVNIKKSGVFDEHLDVRYDYNFASLVTAYDLVIRLYKQFRNKQ